MKRTDFNVIPKKMRVKDAAKLLNLSTRTIYRLVNSNELKAQRLGNSIYVDVADYV